MTITDPAYVDHVVDRGDWLRNHCTCRTRPDGTRFFTCLTNMRGGQCDGEGQTCGGYCHPCFQEVMLRPPRLTFDRLSAVNRQRKLRWHEDEDEPWSGADWSNAMCGEAGEAANVVKKLRRLETGIKRGVDDYAVDNLRAMLEDEVADVILYLDLLCEHYGIDMARAVRIKFNRVSERHGFPERL